MHTYSIIIAAAALLPAVTVADVDFSNGGTFSIGGGFAPNQPPNGGNSDVLNTVNTIVNGLDQTRTVTQNVATAVNSFAPAQTTISNNGQIISGNGQGSGSFQNPNANSQLSGVAQPTLGMDMTFNNSSTPINGASSLQVPELLSLVAHMAGYVGLI